MLGKSEAKSWLIMFIVVTILLVAVLTREVHRTLAWIE